VPAALGGSLAGKRIAVLGLAFKAGTDDMREAPSLSIIPALEERGAHIAAFDPKSFEQARPSLPNTEFAHDARSALKDADAAIILTEWPEFSTLTPADFKGLMKQQVVFDFRNILDRAKFAGAGISLYSVGRAPSKKRDAEVVEFPKRKA